MRLASPRLVAVPIIMLTFALAACGGNTVTVQEVPGDPVDLTVPGTGEALAPDGDAHPHADADGHAGREHVAGHPDARRQRRHRRDRADHAGGPRRRRRRGTRPAGTDSATTDQPPPAGCDAQQFEDFCAENPGAC